MNFMTQTNKVIEMELIEIEIYFNMLYWFISIKLLKHKPIRKQRFYWFVL